MHNITEITKRDILNLFQNGCSLANWLLDNEQIFYQYHGRLSEIDFLKKLYPLDKMKSNDERYETLEIEIRQHTINNDDWENNWVFTDDRFDLLKGNDSVLLDFLSAIFHPENRSEEGHWRRYLEKINAILRADGYELYESESLSQRAVYSWRKISQEELVSGRFIPFSVRNKKSIDSQKIKLPTIPKKVRSEIIQLFNRFNEDLHEKTETNFDYTIESKEVAFRTIAEHYAPHAFDSGKYTPTDNLDDFIMNNYPYCVFDAVELFPRISNSSFVDEINLLLKNNGIIYKLAGGKMELTEMSLKNREIITEPGLKELVEQATNLYNNKSISDKQFAVDKIWDALERLKTYYSSLGKKSSAEKIVNDMSNQNNTYKKLFHDEFLKLTEIGNNFRIRHHETNSVDIIDNNYYDYFFHRCYALIALALKYLK